MPTTEPTYGWRIPTLTDPADGPDGFSEQAADIAATMADRAVLTYVPAWASGGASQPANPSLRTGTYRVDHGLCEVSIVLYFGSTTSGGSGNLTLGLPKAARSDIALQFLVCQTLIPGYPGIIAGLANVSPSAVVCQPTFPQAENDVRMAGWRSALDSGGAGSGVPLVPGQYPIQSGGWIMVHGRYFCIP